MSFCLCACVMLSRTVKACAKSGILICFRFPYFFLYYGYFSIHISSVLLFPRLFLNEKTNVISLLCSAMKERLSAFFQTKFGDICPISGIRAHLVFWFITLSFNMRLFEKNFEIILYDWKERTILADWGLFEWESKIPVCHGHSVYWHCLQILFVELQMACALSLHIQSLWIHISYDLTGKSHAALTCKPCCHMRCLRLNLKVTQLTSKQLQCVHECFDIQWSPWHHASD